MPSLPQVARAMQQVLTTVAEEAAHTTGCVQRQRCFSGASWVQTLVFGCLHSPLPSLTDLSQTAAALGVLVTPQAIAQRFTEATATCLEQVLTAAVTTLVTADPVAIPLLDRFAEVDVLDTTTLRLPPELADRWPGCGNGAHRPAASLKLGVRLDLRHGTLTGPLLDTGRTHDRASAIAAVPLPAGALRLADLGFWSVAELATLTDTGTCWLSRLQAGTTVHVADGTMRSLDAVLTTTTATELDLSVTLGQAVQVPARLLAQRVAPAVAETRRRQLRRDAKRRGHQSRQTTLDRADWLLLVTNVPPERLTLAEATVLARARWQIELLFKLWKRHGHLDAARSADPWRRLGEVYAKLIALVLQHWTLLLGCWHHAARSLVKAAAMIRRHALCLALALPSPARLCQALRTLQASLAGAGAIPRRRTRPSLAQLLLASDEGGLT
ncbi:MAG: IS4 family transposase [Actinobacteria bacterium]|nr:IS4 family transposase [Actinomycetota bacterium]